MAVRKIRDERDAEDCLRAAAESGLPRPAWARAHGINARSLNMWRLITARKQARRAAPASLSLRLVEVAPAVLGPAGYSVWVGPFRVEVADDFDDATLRRLLAVVASC